MKLNKTMTTEKNGDYTIEKAEHKIEDANDYKRLKNIADKIMEKKRNELSGLELLDYDKIFVSKFAGDLDNKKFYWNMMRKKVIKFINFYSETYPLLKKTFHYTKCDFNEIDTIKNFYDLLHKKIGYFSLLHYISSGENNNFIYSFVYYFKITRKDIIKYVHGSTALHALCDDYPVNLFELFKLLEFTRKDFLIKNEYQRTSLSYLIRNMGYDTTDNAVYDIIELIQRLKFKKEDFCGIKIKEIFLYNKIPNINLLTETISKLL